MRVKSACEFRRISWNGIDAEGRGWWGAARQREPDENLKPLLFYTTLTQFIVYGVNKTRERRTEASEMQRGSRKS